MAKVQIGWPNLSFFPMGSKLMGLYRDPDCCCGQRFFGADATNGEVCRLIHRIPKYIENHDI